MAIVNIVRNHYWLLEMTVSISLCLKALCHDIRCNCFLISSLVTRIQSKWVQEVWARPVSLHSAQEYAEIERVQCKDYVDDRVEKLTIFSYGQLKGKNTGEQGP